MREKELKNLLSKKYKPLVGNNRSFSNRATKKSFFNNQQKFKIGAKSYYIPVKLFRTYWIKLKKVL